MCHGQGCRYIFIGDGRPPTFNDGILISWGPGGWFFPTHLKNLLVKLDHFPRVRGENKKSSKPPPTVGPYKPLRTWVDEFIPYYMEIMGVDRPDRTNEITS